MANTVRIKVYRVPTRNCMFICLPGYGKTVVIAPGDWEKDNVNLVVNQFIKRMKQGVKFVEYGQVNLADTYNQRLLKNRKTQKYFVDVVIETA